MDGGERLLVEQLGAAAGDTQVVAQVIRHFAELQRLQMGTGDHPRRERPRGVVQDLVDQRVLAAEHDRHDTLGIELELRQGVQLGEHVEAHQMGFVDDQQRRLLLGPDVGEVVANGGGQRDGRSHPMLQAAGCAAQGGGLAGADLAGDHADHAELDGVVEAIQRRIESGTDEQLIEGDILGKRLVGEPEGVPQVDHERGLRSNSLPPR